MSRRSASSSSVLELDGALLAGSLRIVGLFILRARQAGSEL